MHPVLTFWLIFLLLLSIIIYFSIKYNMLKDISTAERKPYSFSRTQLAWWTVIVLSSFITIIIHKGIPTFHQSTLILLGISSITTAAANLIDVSDENNPKISVNRAQNEETDGFLLDILSDCKGVSIHRLQSVAFNLTFGVWFISQVLINISGQPADNIMPDISQNNLILLGLSSGVYTVLKTSENKEQTAVG